MIPKNHHFPRFSLFQSFSVLPLVATVSAGMFFSQSGFAAEDDQGWTPEAHYGEDFNATPAANPTDVAAAPETPKPKKEKKAAPVPAPKSPAKPETGRDQSVLAQRFAERSAEWAAGFTEPSAPIKLEPLTPEGEQAVKNLAQWAKQVAAGDYSKGRLLPVSGNWNADADKFSPNYFVELIRQGHHVAVAFLDPQSAAFNASTQDGRVGPKLQEALDTYYRPALEFAKAHNLPIVFRGWNWAADPSNYQQKLATQRGVEFATEDLAAVLVDGKPDFNTTDPLGPIAAWETWGQFWFGNVLMRELQKIYPNPPLVIFLNNNEAGDGAGAGGYEKSDRFVAKFGDQIKERSEVNKIIREGYAERYAAMFEAAKDSLISPAWKKNARFVAYNTIFGAAYFGNGRFPMPGVGFDMELGPTKWRIYDGSMPEAYDNDWQLGKRDYTPWNMQTEMGAVHGFENHIRKERPNFISGMILWDGAIMSEVFRGRRGTSKPFYLASRGLRWDFDRYEGWATFATWALRPTLLWEFRAGEPLDAMRLGTWEAQLRMTDQVWNTPVLREFWERGTLVPNTEQEPWFNQFPEDTPEWVKKLDRYFLLTSDANPPRAEWHQHQTTLRVIAQALEVGEKPNRRWLIIAHSPEKATPASSISLPGYGPVALPSLSKLCSFFLLNEKDGSLETIQRGGPAALDLQIVSEGERFGPNPWFAPGTDVTLEVAVSHAPGLQLDEFVWNFGDGKTQTESSAGKLTHRFDKEGTYLVTVDARQGGETKIREQVAVFVGKVPSQDVIYDLVLDEAFDWKGPWAGVGKDGSELVTYSHLPNRGRPFPAVIVGGRFVDDPERGRVYEMTGAQHDGIYLARSIDTVLREGRRTSAGPNGPGADAIQGNRTISFWFKAEDVQTRQVLFAEGFNMVGMNIYLDAGNLYAGCFATPDGTVFGQDPVSGYNWPGEWLSTPVEAGKWVHVTWVLQDATNAVEPEKQSLYVNGKLVGRAAAGGLPRLYVVPRIGRTNLDNDMMNNRKNSLTRFHDEAERGNVAPRDRNAINHIPIFKGRIDDFRYVNAVELPE